MNCCNVSLADYWQVRLGVGLPLRAGTTDNDVNSARFFFTLVKIATPVSAARELALLIEQPIARLR